MYEQLLVVASVEKPLEQIQHTSHSLYAKPLWEIWENGPYEQLSTNISRTSSVDCLFVHLQTRAPHAYFELNIW